MSTTIDTGSPYNVDYSTTEVVNVWRTKRLEFINIDESDENIREFLPQVDQDPVVVSLVSPRLLGPQGKKALDDGMASRSKSLLGVAICLRPDEKEEESYSPKVNKKPTIIGTMCLAWGGINPSEAHHRSAHIGIGLGKAYQSKGYGREAINWIVDWAFMYAGLHKLGMIAASYNQRGIHLYQSIGFKLEGRRREVIYFNRGWYDELDFGMTEGDWEELRGISKSS
ncbi:hypothetical protein QQS21_011503 [Conoideocrella luteorostrata]|uniref:N-acetyltransferase domain-containing protein n=1 Tax=Conoideocrella luteorostrata TaxID=1105319 RepID=A0AAJ0FNB8_9HYPO|nr:hypothetical protein QQS21_011503 [Conoideocrella luteorostrata]